MKFWQCTPQNFYIPNLGSSLIGSLNPNRNFNLWKLRDTETGEEVKFLESAANASDSISELLPFDPEFLKKYFSNVYLESADGTYKSKLLIKTNADGTQTGWPMQTLWRGSGIFDRYQNLYMYNFVDLVTEDGQWVIWMSSVGTLGNFCDYDPPRGLPLTYTSKKVVQMVLTKAADYHKPLGLVSHTQTVFLNGTKFYVGNYENLNTYNQTNFIDYEENRTVPYKMTWDHRYSHKNAIGYQRTAGKLAWLTNATVPPPDGYELEYDLKTAEQWQAVNAITTDSKIYRIPPWSGNRAIYLFSYGSATYFKTQPLSILKYSDDDKKWYVYSNGIPVYRCDSQVEFFDNSQTYHFDFIGTLSETDRPEIANGFDFKINRLLDLSATASSIDCRDGDRDRVKRIVRNYKIETGAPSFYVFDQPVFI